MKSPKQIELICELFRGASCQATASAMTLIYLVLVAAFSVPSSYCMGKNERSEMRLVSMELDTLQTSYIM